MSDLAGWEWFLLYTNSAWLLGLWLGLVVGVAGRIAKWFW